MTDIKHKSFTPPSIEELQAQHNAGEVELYRKLSDKYGDVV